MKIQDFKKLLIRNAVVRDNKVGYVLAYDPIKIEKEIPHTIFSVFSSGKWKNAESNFSAHDCCLVSEPEFGIVTIAGQGQYSVQSRSGAVAGNIFRRSRDYRKTRYGDFRSVVEIEGVCYAAGFEGTVFRMLDFNSWEPIDRGLPKAFNIEDIDGFASDDLFVAGFKGTLFQFNGKKWERIDIPTNTILDCIKCAKNGEVYIGGHGGVIVVGSGQKWKVLDQDLITEDIWDIEEFKDKIYISTLEGVYRIDEEGLSKVKFGRITPATTYQLSACDDVLWSIGLSDIVSFDGKKWSRII